MWPLPSRPQISRYHNKWDFCIAIENYFSLAIKPRTLINQPTSNLTVLTLNLNVPEQLLLDLVAAVLNDPLHLLVDELHAPQAGLLQSLDLSLDQELKADLGDKQRWPGAVTVPDGRQDVHGC